MSQSGIGLEPVRTHPKGQRIEVSLGSGPVPIMRTTESAVYIGRGATQEEAQGRLDELLRTYALDRPSVAGPAGADPRAAGGGLRQPERGEAG